MRILNHKGGIDVVNLVFCSKCLSFFIISMVMLFHFRLLCLRDKQNTEKTGSVEEQGKEFDKLKKCIWWAKLDLLIVQLSFAKSVFFTVILSFLIDSKSSSLENLFTAATYQILAMLFISYLVVTVFFNSSTKET